jgi:hypothetical protein
VEVLQNLAVACQQVPLRSNKEALQAALEGCGDLLGCSKAIKPPASCAPRVAWVFASMTQPSKWNVALTLDNCLPVSVIKIVLWRL